MRAAYREKRAALGGRIWNIGGNIIDKRGNMAGGDKKTATVFV
jgi:hypothetical protein